MADFRRPGVYIEEKLATSPFESANATAVACFVGVAPKGEPFTAIRCDSWSDYVQKFGGFDMVPWATAASSSPGRTINGTTVSGNPTVTVTTGTITAADIGRTVTGTGIAAGATIISYADGTHFTMSANATAAGTAVVLTLGAKSIPAQSGTVLSYLPYAVYSYFQNGGRGLYVVRTMPANAANRGATATATVDAAAGGGTSFVVSADGAGVWGNNCDVTIEEQATVGTAPNDRSIFSLAVTYYGQRVETFSNLSMGGIEGTRPVATAVNDAVAGSRYISISGQVAANDPETGSVTLAGGADPALPTSTDLISSLATDAVTTIEGPLIVSFQPFMSSADIVVMPPPQAISGFTGERSDVITIWDGDPASLLTNPKADVLSKAAQLGTADSYSSIYTPWIIVPDPARAGGTVAIPPSGAMSGVMSRIDVTQGVWRTPAGAPAAITNAVSVELKYSETDQGELNFNNVNVIRPLIGAGVCAMGGRTRKLWGADRYIAPRRTLIFIKETLRRATSFAVFENNDSHLWSALRQTAISILTPIWEQGGLKGVSGSEAFFVRCDATVNTPQVIQSGEVRMEIGVALQYPAEFVIIRISQFDSGSSFAVEGIVTGA